MNNKGYDDHLRRMAEMKSVTDSGPPRSAGKSRRREIERRRHYAAIELDNRLLLERLAKIMQKKTIDNENHNIKFRRSLTDTHRKLELQRITQENQRLLRRIQETEPCYNHLQWEEEHKRRQVYIRNMSEFQDPPVGSGTNPALQATPSPQRRHKALRPLSSDT